jgi:hypothetical protein
MIGPDIILQMLRDIDDYLWEVSLFILFVLLLLPIRNKEMSSSTIAVTVLVVIGAIDNQYGRFIVQVDPAIALTDVQLWLKVHDQFMLFVWYLGFFILHNLVILCIYHLYKKYDLRNSYITKTILLASFAAGILQLTRLTERYIFSTDYLNLPYQWGIPSIHIGMIAVVSFFTITKASQYCKDKLAERSLRRKY